MALPVCHFDIENLCTITKFSFVQLKKSREATCKVTRRFVLKYLLRLVVMSTRFLKDHIEIKWWTDGYYHNRKLFYAHGTCTQSWSQFSRSL